MDGQHGSTPWEESNIALYTSSPFYPHLAPMHFYLDNPTIPLEVRQNIPLLQFHHSSTPGGNNHHSFLRLLERYAQEGTRGAIHAEVERTLLFWVERLATWDQHMPSVGEPWNDLGKEWVQRGITPYNVFPVQQGITPYEVFPTMQEDGHPTILGMGDRLTGALKSSRRHHHTPELFLERLRGEAWAHHALGCWKDGSQRHVRESNATKLLLNDLIDGTGIHDLGNYAREYRVTRDALDTPGIPAMKLSSSLLNVNYSLTATLLELSGQVNKLHILEHHERITPERWREFSNLRHEYNLEWALASFDWSGGRASLVNRINYGQGGDGQ